MNENVSIEVIRVDNSAEKTEKEIPEILTLTQKAVYEQMEGFIAPLTRQSVVEWNIWGHGDNILSKLLPQDCF